MTSEDFRDSLRTERHDERRDARNLPDDGDDWPGIDDEDGWDEA